MHLAAYAALLFALLVSLFFAGWAALAVLRGRPGPRLLAERAQLAAAALVTLATLVISIALVARDYSFVYVYENVDNGLPLTYRLAALWAGQSGSLLFWAWAMAVGGAAFAFTRGYKALGERTKLFYWMFFMALQAGFLLLLTNWSNPCLATVPRPADGLGLNPLLQNPAMAFHPPLLFLGYALFGPTAACGLAAMLAAEPKSWIRICRNWNLLAWVFLTAGIILGGWWSYMELGWGGYWAWDPVENASLIPWFSATAFLHTALVEVRRGALARTNVFLMALTLGLCLFATWLVRSGVNVQSLHTFGAGGVALPLELMMYGVLGVTLAAVYLAERPAYRALHGIFSRQGLLLVVAWVLLVLGLVVGVGTMWPVISTLWSPTPVGLDEAFYNRVCLPFFSLLVLLYCVCPWLGWREGVRDKRGLLAVAGVFAVFLVIFFLRGVRLPLALVTAAGAGAAVAGVVMLVAAMPGIRQSRSSWAAHGVHLGLALMALGVAFSGPYTESAHAKLMPGQTLTVKDYAITNAGLTQRQDGEVLVFAALAEVKKDGKPVGALVPEQRWYPNSTNSYAEVSVIPGLGDEVYSTLTGYDTRDGSMVLEVSVHPLVNWIWVGGTLMCLAGFLLLRREKL
ncbi:MAG: heme lyase CcmF/NrfE family subunit [Desulfovibrionaceae bacterium]